MEDKERKRQIQQGGLLESRKAGEGIARAWSGLLCTDSYTVLITASFTVIKCKNNSMNVRPTTPPFPSRVPHRLPPFPCNCTPTSTSLRSPTPTSYPENVKRLRSCRSCSRLLPLSKHFRNTAGTLALTDQTFTQARNHKAATQEMIS
jgi:hypothetical protein